MGKLVYYQDFVDEADVPHIEKKFLNAMNKIKAQKPKINHSEEDDPLAYITLSYSIPKKSIGITFKHQYSGKVSIALNNENNNTSRIERIIQKEMHGPLSPLFIENWPAINKRYKEILENLNNYQEENGTYYPSEKVVNF